MSTLREQEQDFDDLHFPHSKQRRAGIIAFGSLSVTYECDSDGADMEVHTTRLMGKADLESALNAVLKHDGSTLCEVIASARDAKQQAREVLV